MNKTQLRWVRSFHNGSGRPVIAGYVGDRMAGRIWSVGTAERKVFHVRTALWLDRRPSYLVGPHCEVASFVTLSRAKKSLEELVSVVTVERSMERSLRH